MEDATTMDSGLAQRLFSLKVYANGVVRAESNGLLARIYEVIAIQNVFM